MRSCNRRKSGISALVQYAIVKKTKYYYSNNNQCALSTLSTVHLCSCAAHRRRAQLNTILQRRWSSLSAVAAENGKQRKSAVCVLM